MAACARDRGRRAERLRRDLSGRRLQASITMGLWSRLVSVTNMAALDTEEGSKCPVMHKQRAAPPESREQPSASSACPVLRKNGCTSEDLNPLNRMPASPEQQRAPGQASALPTDRVTSTIPRADGGLWEYPSPQMFFNALMKKGKGGGVDEQDMTSVVAIHNNMNETTWRQVLEWEDMHCDTCKEPRRLIRFLGRPDELSPKAALKYYLGLAPRPFDRHDWTVDRCGTEVRYIIDYYDVAEKRAEDRVPSQMHEKDAVPSIYCDVRPAGDSFEQLADRMRMMATSAFSQRAASNADVPRDAAREATEPSEKASALANESSSGAAAVNQACATYVSALQSCDNERDCAQAHIGLMLCIAQQVCSKEAAEFTALRGVASDSSAADAGERFARMETCVSKWAAAQAAAEETSGCPVK